MGKRNTGHVHWIAVIWSDDEDEWKMYGGHTKWNPVGPLVCDGKAAVENTSSDELTHNEALRAC
jgi:hypothetical protein